MLQAHSSIKKACMVAGTPHCRLLPARPELDYALDPADLSAAIEEDIASGLIPFYLVGTIGSTSSCAVDPIAELAAVAQKHSMWYGDACHQAVFTAHACTYVRSAV